MKLKSKVFQNKNHRRLQYLQPPERKCEGGFASSVQVGDLVEVCARRSASSAAVCAVGGQGVWGLGTVIGVKRDTRGAVRLVQVLVTM